MKKRKEAAGINYKLIPQLLEASLVLPAKSL